MANVEDIGIVYASNHLDHSPFYFTNSAIIDHVNSLNKTHIIFNAADDDIRFSHLMKLQTIAELMRGTKHKFYFLTSTVGLADQYTKWCRELGWDKLLVVLETKITEVLTTVRNFPASKTYEIYPREKTFLSFNRVPRVHRLKLVDTLLAKNLITNNYVSLGCDGTWEEQQRYLNNNKETFSNILASDIFPLNLNITKERHNPVELLPEDDIYFDNSYFSVVTETSYRADEGDFHFFTEKTYKPIIMCHPFMIVARPNVLKAMRLSGFKTFHPFIDESYDDIVDDDLRLQYIANEIERLSKFTQTQWNEWMRNIKPIVEYNYDRWKNNDNYWVTSDHIKYFTGE